MCFGLCLATSAKAVAPTRLVYGEPAFRIENGNVQVLLSLSVDQEDGLRDMLKDGAVLELGIGLSLERKRSWWSDAQTASVRYSSVIMHDSLSRDFIVLVPGPGGTQELRDRNLTRLLYASWRALVLPLASLDVLTAEDPDEIFNIVASISLRHTDVPPWLEKSIIWSSDVVPSERLVFPFHFPAHNKAAP